MSVNLAVDMTWASRAQKADRLYYFGKRKGGICPGMAVYHENSRLIGLMRGRHVRP